jgi:hypothetical protein
LADEGVQEQTQIVLSIRQGSFRGLCCGSSQHGFRGEQWHGRRLQQSIKDGKTTDVWTGWFRTAEETFYCGLENSFQNHHPFLFSIASPKDRKSQK